VQQAVDGLKKLASDALAKGDGATALKRAEQAQRLAPNDGQVQQLLQKARAAGAASRPAR
jgi:Flp pilus assembly protein TadD